MLRLVILKSEDYIEVVILLSFKPLVLRGHCRQVNVAEKVPGISIPKAVIDKHLFLRVQIIYEITPDVRIVKNGAFEAVFEEKSRGTLAPLGQAHPPVRILTVIARNIEKRQVTKGNYD